MLAYAVRFDIDEIILFYPNTIRDNQGNSTEFKLKDELAKGKEISIKAFQLPILNSAILDQPLATNTTLSELFEDTKQELKTKIKNIFKQEL